MLCTRTETRRLSHVLRRLASWPEARYLRRPRDDAVVVDVARFPYMGFGATVAWIHMAQVAADAVSAPLWFVNPGEWPFGGRRPDLTNIGCPGSLSSGSGLRTA